MINEVIERINRSETWCFLLPLNGFQEIKILKKNSSNNFRRNDNNGVLECVQYHIKHK